MNCLAILLYQNHCVKIVHIRTRLESFALANYYLKTMWLSCLRYIYENQAQNKIIVIVLKIVFAYFWILPFLLTHATCRL